jgi:hypothetical protein
MGKAPVIADSEELLGKNNVVTISTTCHFREYEPETIEVTAYAIGGVIKYDGVIEAARAIVSQERSKSFRWISCDRAENRGKCEPDPIWYRGYEALYLRYQTNTSADGEAEHPG